MIAMKIDPAFSASLSSITRASTARAAAAGFQLSPMEASQEPARVAQTARATQINLISAITGEDEKRQRRQRRHAHVSALLDRLDGLVLALLSGRVESEVPAGLIGALQGGPEASDDPVLEALVEAVELRAAVEMAKLKAQKRGRSG